MTCQQSRATIAISGKARTESKVQRLGGEVPDDVGGVTSPERENTLVTSGTSKAVPNTLVGLGETTLFDLKGDNSVRTGLNVQPRGQTTHHLILVLDEELDTLDGSGGGLGDSL